jgi:hypothetical protein
LVFVVVERLPEANPNIEQAQAATKTTKEAVRDYGAKSGKREQEVIIGPLGGPRENDEQNSSYGTDQNKKKNRRTMHPDLQGAGTWVSFTLVGRVQKCRAALSLRCRGVRSLASSLGKGGRVRHRWLRKEKAGKAPLFAPGPGWNKLGRKAIELFYDFKALIRSATSR